MLLDPSELQELQAVFQVEGQERIQNLNDLLVRLEQAPQQKSLLEATFREAHSLKGAANALGLIPVGDLCHRLEDRLGEAKRGTVLLTKADLELLYLLVDQISAALQQVFAKFTLPDTTNPADPAPDASQTSETGTADALLLYDEEWNGNEEGILETTVGVKSESEPVSLLPAALPPESEGARTAAPGSSFVPSPAVASGKEQTLIPPRGEKATFVSSPTQVDETETIRVGVPQLDELLSQAGELLIAKSQAQLHTREIEALSAKRITDLQQLNRSRSLLRHTQQVIAGQEALTPGDLQRLLALIQQQRDLLEKSTNDLHSIGMALTQHVSHIDQLSETLVAGLKTARMLPVGILFKPFGRIVRDLAVQLNKQVTLQLEGSETRLDKKILEELKDPLLHLVRNALDHGLESPQERQELGKAPTGLIRLAAWQEGNMVHIEVSDDGRGISVEQVKMFAVQRGVLSEEEAARLDTQQILHLLFTPGFSTRRTVTQFSGRGVGLDVVEDRLKTIKGTVKLASEIKRGTTCTLRIPLTLSTTEILLLDSAGQIFGLPTTFVKESFLINPQQVQTLEGHQVIVIEKQVTPVVVLQKLLGLPAKEKQSGQDSLPFPVVVIDTGTNRVALQVDAILGLQEVVMKNLEWPLHRITTISGGTILGAGSICLILNDLNLLRASLQQNEPAQEWSPGDTPPAPPHILVVDDSITTRILERNILQAAGYEVTLAVDGRQALLLTMEHSFDAIISDIEMPFLNGFELVSTLKADSRTRNIPVILVTSLANPDDRKRGSEVGADAYLVKSSFDQNQLLETLQKLVG